MIDQTELDRKYDRGKRFAIMYKGKPVSYSQEETTALKHMYDLAKKYEPDELKMVPIRSLMDKVPNDIKDQRYLDEVNRIKQLVNPITEDEMEEVRKIAAQNVMQKDLEDIVCRAIMER
tara:strand:+ start:234 stop:590 length:357 start_codon:yes stop_codon:yes gene_type:complete